MSRHVNAMRTALVILAFGAASAADAQPATVGQDYYRGAQATNSLWRGVFGNYKTRITNLLIEAKVRKIEKELGVEGIQDGGALFEIEVFQIMEGVWVESWFLAFGPTISDAFRRSEERPGMRAPLSHLPHTPLGRSLVYATQVDGQIRAEVIPPEFSAVIKGQVLRQMAAQQELMRQMTTPPAPGGATPRPDRSSDSPRPHDGDNSGSRRSGGGQSGSGGGTPPGSGGGESSSGGRIDRGGIPGTGPPPLRVMRPPELGAIEGRAWADFNGDGFDDYCRVLRDVVPTQMLVTLSTGPNYEDRADGPLITSPPLDPGYGSGRAWVDFNRDGKADYVRVVGTQEQGFHLLVTYSEGSGFGRSLPASPPIDPGRPGSRVWIDWDNDGYVDFVRIIGRQNHTHAALAVTFGQADGFGETIRTSEQPFDWGYPESQLWIDINGDEKPDFVRVVGNDRDLVAVTLSTGRGFSATTREALPSPEIGKAPPAAARAPVETRATPLTPGRTEPPRNVPRPPVP